MSFNRENVIWYSMNSEVDNLLDSMISAQRANGQIVWMDTRPTSAAVQALLDWYKGTDELDGDLPSE